MENERGLDNENIPPHGEEANMEKIQEETHVETFKEEFIQDLSSIIEGEIVEGKVVAVSTESVFVDVGYKSEGEIPLNDFTEKPKKGDVIHVMIVKKESRDGRLILSKKKADEVVQWDQIVQSFKQEVPVKGTVIEKTKGGFTVDLYGYKAFLPLSQISTRRTEEPEKYVGNTLLCKIERLNGKNNIVLSHKKYLEEERERNILDFFNSKKDGDVIEGIVKDILGYGAFIDLGSIDGLLHVNDMSWGRVSDPKKYLKKGEKLELKILSIDRESRKISLGLKQLVPDPWGSFEERYQSGGKYTGRVTKLTNFGAFIELEEGIEGLLHVSELSWTRRINHPKEILKTGDIVEIMILDYNLNKRTVSLGLKQVLPNPWDSIDTKYPVGSQIEVKVSKVIKSGVFVELEEGIEGYLRVNDISWTKQIKNPANNFKKGDTLEAVVLEIDRENHKIQLGMKQLTENPWTNLKLKYPKGSIITGKISSVTEFGVFVKLDNEIEGLIHVSQLSSDKIANPGPQFKVGQNIRAIIIEIDEQKKKVSLSVKELLNKLEEKEIQKYIEDDTEKTASVTLGDLIDLTKIGK